MHFVPCTAQAAASFYKETSADSPYLCQAICMASLPQASPSSHVASVLCEHPSYRQRYQSSGLHHMQEMPAEANCAESTYATRTNSCRRGIELPCQCAKVVMRSCATLEQESPVCENRVWLAQFIVHQVHDCGQISLVAIL